MNPLDQNPRRRDWRDAAIMAALFLLTLALYARVATYEFILFDDSGYVHKNERVKGGLSVDSIHWAFTTLTFSNWHPITWLSYMLDKELFNLHPGAMHLENVLFHCVNTVLLFWLLMRATQSRWASAWVAAMFAWHPLHVESVAWISERKDVISTLFMFLCLLAYVRYVERRGIGRYLLIMLMLALGLMTKPMLVTVPCVMLLMDIWPLNRLGGRWTIQNVARLVIEKIPLFAMVMGSAVITVVAQSRSTMSLRTLPPEQRAVNAVVSYAEYLWQMIWPKGLAIFYPHPVSLGKTIPPAAIAGSVICLAAITLVSVACRRKAPWLLFGWLWYVGTLVPVIGLLQVGSQAMADRYTYIPLIGIFIALGWTVDWLWKQSSPAKPVLGTLAVLSLGGAVIVTSLQIPVWRNGETVMRHAIAVVPDNYVAHVGLGEVFDHHGNSQAAIEEYNKALKIQPEDAVALNNLALHVLDAGRKDEAEDLFKRAIASKSRDATAYNNYGNLLKGKGETEEAINVYRKALELDHSLWQAAHNLALLLAQQGKVSEAIPLWERAIAFNPEHAEAHFRMGQALMATGKSAEAIEHLRNALRLQPDRPDMLDSLAWILATNPNPQVQNGREAMTLAERACELTKRSEPAFMDTLAAAQARIGQFGQAEQTAQAAVALAQEQNKTDLAGRISARQELYKAGKAYTSGGN